ncbi:hypothetical protein DK254_31635 [Pseudomonas sp. RW407]|nr:hypothetical protein DK254_31635 [Pseudomonas sp. RW407]
MLATLLDEDAGADGKDATGGRLGEVRKAAVRRGRSEADAGRYAWLMALSPGRAFIVVAASIGTANSVLQ